MRIVTKAVVPACIALLMLWASPLHAEPVSWTGTWKLNLEKSDFGKEPKPKELILKIEDKEPVKKYSVTGTDDKEQPFNFEWQGGVDGKPRKETGPQGGTTVTLKEINDYAVEGTKISADGKKIETFTSTLSKDGKAITEKWTMKGRRGSLSYDSCMTNNDLV